jgi:hypothetical protein
MNLKLLAVLALAVLCGCETYYKVPDAQQPTAKVRFRAVGSIQSILVGTMANEKCDKDAASGIMGVVGGVKRDPMGNVPKEVGEAGNTQRMIGYNEAEGILPIERLVRGDRPFVFSVQRIQVSNLGTVRSCRLSYALDVRPNGQYEVEYFEDTARCYLLAHRLEAASAGVNRIPETLRATPALCPVM